MVDNSTPFMASGAAVSAAAISVLSRLARLEAMSERARVGWILIGLVLTGLAACAWYYASVIALLVIACSVGDRCLS
jgi:hypothetical protein